MTKIVFVVFLGNFWQHIGTAGLIMSYCNADVVRLKAKQHPCVIIYFRSDIYDKIVTQVVLCGPMGIRKSSCQDVCMWNLCGTKEVCKIDSYTRNTTVKRVAAL